MAPQHGELSCLEPCEHFIDMSQLGVSTKESPENVSKALLHFIFKIF